MAVILSGMAGCRYLAGLGLPRPYPEPISATASVETRPATHGLHRAWFVAAITMGALIAAAGFRSSTGALLEPLEQDFGWSRRPPAVRSA